MTVIRPCAFALVASISAMSASATPSLAARYDGGWSMVAVTTHGHCGVIDIGLGVQRGRITSTGGSFAAYPIRLVGRVSPAGRVTMRAVAGPRTANGTGRFRVAGGGGGTWSGRGPSGLCSGTWSASRS